MKQLNLYNIYSITYLILSHIIVDIPQSKKSYQNTFPLVYEILANKGFDFKLKIASYKAATSP